MENTGERILTEKESPMFIARHFCAYRFAAPYAQGKNALDLGCGEGYGSNYLADFADKVVAVDYNPDAIEYAKKKYHRSNLEFVALNIKDLNKSGLSADLVTSFQVIEHLFRLGYWKQY